MKTYGYLLIVVLLVFSGNFTFGQTRIFPGLAFGSEIETVGITVGAEHFVSNKVSISPDLIFYFPNKESSVSGGNRVEARTNLWELNGNVHYYFVSEPNISFYGLGGLNYSHVGFEYKRTDTDSGEIESQFEGNDGEIGLNLGIGANFPIRRNFIPYVELKYVAASTDQLVISAGLKFDI
jgi:outer membrane protein X